MLQGQAKTADMLSGWNPPAAAIEDMEAEVRRPGPPRGGGGGGKLHSLRRPGCGNEVVVVDPNSQNARAASKLSPPIPFLISSGGRSKLVLASHSLSEGLPA